MRKMNLFIQVLYIFGAALLLLGLFCSGSGIDVFQQLGLQVDQLIYKVFVGVGAFIMVLSLVLASIAIDLYHEFYIECERCKAKRIQNSYANMNSNL